MANKGSPVRPPMHSNRHTTSSEQNWNAAAPLQRRTALQEIRSALRSKRLLLAAAALGGVAALIVSAIEPRIYQSHASVQIQGLNENFLNLREIYPTAAPSADNAVYIQTQAEILKQDALIEQVIRKLHLDQREEFRGAFKADTWRIAEQIKRNIQIAPIRGSSIIRIICDARTPQLAADLANTLAQTFIDQAVEFRQRGAKQTEAALAGELVEVKRNHSELQAELDAYSGRMAPWRQADVASYQTVKRQLDANRQLYDVLSRRVNEARLASTLDQANVRLVGPAQPAVQPYKPDLLLNLLAGGFGGLVLGIGFLMWREQTQTMIRAPGDAAAFLGVPELGAIPKLNRARFAHFGIRRVTSGLASIERAAFEHASSGVSESFRAIVASILASSRNGDHPRVLLITSARPMEGKTTVVSNLGRALAEIGNKVLLIDGDLRRPSLHKSFDQGNSWGLSDLLQEKNAIEELPLDSLVRRTAVSRLFVLPGGSAAENIFGLLWSAQMTRLFRRFRQEFDYVLVDAPPCLEFADARIIGRYTDEALLVVRADSTERATAQSALQRLFLDGISVTGVVLNRWDASNSDGYAYSYRRQDAA